MSAVATLRHDGMPDDVLRDLLTNRPVSAAERDAAERLMRRRQADPEWVKRLMQNDYDVKREFTLVSAILAAEVAQ